MSHLAKDFETPTDVELTDHQILDAERLVVKYAHEMGELTKDVEIEDFEIVRIDECMSAIEIKALTELMEDDNSFDLDFEEFYVNYVALAGDIKTKQVLKQGDSLKLDLSHIFGDIGEALADIRVA